MSDINLSLFDENMKRLILERYEPQIKNFIYSEMKDRFKYLYKDFLKETIKSSIDEIFNSTEQDNLLVNSIYDKLLNNISESIKKEFDKNE